MLVPPPTPLYTLAPSINDLEQATHDLVERCVASLTGHFSSVFVTGVRTTARHHVVELATATGNLRLMEIIEPPTR